MRNLCSLHMEAISPPLRPLCNPNASVPSRKSKRLLRTPQSTTLYRFPSFSPPFSASRKIFRKNSVVRESIGSRSVSDTLSQDRSQEFALLLEVDGVLVDAYRWGNRQAFNTAFRKLGLDCANWSEPIYLDLVRKGAGDEERMLILFFNRIGWPTSLPTSDRSSFVKSVLREKKNAMDELVMSKDVPLRPGLEEFIDDAYDEGVPVVILTSYSKSGEKVARSVVEKLGSKRLSMVKVVGQAEVEQSLYGQLVFGKEVSSSLDEMLAKEVRKAASAEKQRVAKEVAAMLKVSVEIDTSSSESLEKIVGALRSGAEVAEVPVSSCVLVAGSKSGVAAAERIGMPSVVVRSSLTSRAEFPSAKVIMDGFGGADLTVAKLMCRRWS